MKRDDCYYCHKKISGKYVLIESDYMAHLSCMKCTTNRLTIVECKNCGSKFLNFGYQSIDFVCRDCADDFVSCRYCRKFVPKDKANKIYNAIACNDCFNHGKNRVQDYSFQPELKFYGSNSKSDDLLLGIELEVDFCYMDNWQNIINIDMDYFYCKYDSSIPETAFEIVSHPITFEYLKKHRNIIKDNIIDLESKYGAYSGKDSGCGLHIHMSKNAFGNYHIWKLLRFIYHKSNRDFLIAFSGRSKVSMSEWAKISAYNSDNKKRAMNKDQAGMDRHHAVNLQRDSTIELRIFEGTLDKDRLWAYIEFTKALYEFTKIANPTDLKIGKFISFVSKDATHSSRFKNCLNLLRKTRKALDMKDEICYNM